MFPGFAPAMSTSYLMEQYPNLSYLRDNSELQLLSRRTQTPLNLEKINELNISHKSATLSKIQLADVTHKDRHLYSNTISLLFVTLRF